MSTGWDARVGDMAQVGDVGGFGEGFGDGPEVPGFVRPAAPPPCDAEEEAFDRQWRALGPEWIHDVWLAGADLALDDGSVGRMSAAGPARAMSGVSCAAEWFPPPATPVARAADAYAQLAELDRAAALLELRRADLLAWLIESQSSSDLRRLGPDAVPSDAEVARAREDARVTVIDTLVATTGARRGPWLARAQIALAAPVLAEPLREAVGEQVLTFEQAADIVRDSGEIDLPLARRAHLAKEVVTHAAAVRARCGAPVAQRQFRAALRRQLVRHGGAHARRRAVDEARGVWLQAESDGAATLTITGRDARGVAALTRLDAIARSVRQAGDPRTLQQLRSDVALDLLIFGRPDAQARTAVDHPDGEGWPPAVVDVVVSAATLLGANDEPGLVHDTPVAADTIRRLALAEGGVWRRIVTDPVTGYAMAAEVDSYRPPAAMARVVRARDGRCRAPVARSRPESSISTTCANGATAARPPRPTVNACVARTTRRRPAATGGPRSTPRAS